jgi:hypothetical protein
VGWFEGFPFQSKEDRERKAKEFEDRVFPFGVEAQRNAVTALLKELGTSPKAQTQDLLYAYISAKDKYVLKGKDENAFSIARQQVTKLKWVEASDRRIILAMIKLDTDIQSLENYPTADEIRTYANTVLM